MNGKYILYICLPSGTIEKFNFCCYVCAVYGWSVLKAILEVSERDTLLDFEQLNVQIPLYVCLTV